MKTCSFIYFVIEDDIDDDETEVTIRVYGDDENEDFEHYDEITFSFEIDRERDEISIISINFNKDSYGCNDAYAELDLKYKNNIKFDEISFSKKDYYFGIRPEHFTVSSDCEYKFKPKIDLTENLGNEKIAYIKIDGHDVSAKIPTQNNAIDQIGFSTNDIFVFDENGTRGYGAAAKVSIIKGKFVTLVSTATSTISNVEFFSGEEKNSFTDFSNNTEKKSAGVFISFAKKKGSNAPLVSKNIQEKSQLLIEQNFGPEINVQVLRDDGAVAEKEIKGLMINLMISIVIVGIVLFLFLSMRPALIVMGTIPIILLLVFIPGYLAGETINRITLFALILSLGLLVDSATVVVENIYRQIKKHPEKGMRILSAYPELSEYGNYAFTHHENFDGTGYPRGLKAEDIPLFSRIICIADAFDAMTNNRTYRQAMTVEMAMKEIAANSGTQFDPEVVNVFTEILK